MSDLTHTMAAGLVAPGAGDALRAAMSAALHAHDVLGLRGEALASYMRAAADAADAAMPGGLPTGVPARGEWHRVSSTTGMVPLAEAIRMFGADPALMAQLAPIAAAEGVEMTDIVVAKRDHGFLELAFYAPWKGGGFAPIFSVEYQQ